MSPVSVSTVAIPPPWTTEGHRKAAAWFGAMLKRGSIALDDASGVLIYLGYDAVRDFLSEPGIWSLEGRLPTSAASEAIRLLSIDPPLHRQVRSHFTAAYRPQRIKEIENGVRTVARDPAKLCAAKGTFDVAEEYIKPISVAGICELIGIPENGQELMMVLDEVGSNVAPIRDAASSALIEQLSVGSTMNGVDKVLPYFRGLIEERRQEPQDDLVSALATMPPIQAGHRFIDVAAFLYEQFFAGINTTVHCFASMILELDRHRAILAQIRDDHSLIKPFVEEVLRLHSPIQARPRVAIRDAVMDGITIREGDWGLGFISAANRDPAMFPDPDRLNLERPANQQVAFGRGPHFCIGAHLARMELQVAMEEWLDAIPDFAAVEPGVESWIPDFVLHGLSSFPVAASTHTT